MSKLPVYEHIVQYYETDRMQVVHHSNYIRWFEEARIYIFEKIGLDECRRIALDILIDVADFCEHDE